MVLGEIRGVTKPFASVGVMGLCSCTLVMPVPSNWVLLAFGCENHSVKIRRHNSLWNLLCPIIEVLKQPEVYILFSILYAWRDLSI